MTLSLMTTTTVRLVKVLEPIILWSITVTWQKYRTKQRVKPTDTPGTFQRVSVQKSLRLVRKLVIVHGPTPTFSMRMPVLTHLAVQLDGRLKMADVVDPPPIALLS